MKLLFFIFLLGAPAPYAESNTNNEKPLQIASSALPQNTPITQEVSSAEDNLGYTISFDGKRQLKYLGVIFIIIGLALYSNRKLYKLNKRLNIANAELARLSEMDSLTKIKNRKFLTDQLPSIVKVANRNHLSLGIAMLDIDHFKQLNDNCGHIAGDECLVAFASVMNEVFQRESDSSIRYGGEEFALFCIGMTAEQFTQSLERLRSKTESLMLPLYSGKTASFTVSIGYIFHNTTPNQRVSRLIAEADEKLYLAKKAGRNQVLGTTI